MSAKAGLEVQAELGPSISEMSEQHLRRSRKFHGTEVESPSASSLNSFNLSQDAKKESGEHGWG